MTLINVEDKFIMHKNAQHIQIFLFYVQLESFDFLQEVQMGYYSFLRWSSYW